MCIPHVAHVTHLPYNDVSHKDDDEDDVEDTSTTCGTCTTQGWGWGWCRRCVYHMWQLLRTGGSGVDWAPTYNCRMGNGGKRNINGNIRWIIDIGYEYNMVCVWGSTYHDWLPWLPWPSCDALQSFGFSEHHQLSVASLWELPWHLMIIWQSLILPQAMYIS